MRGFFHGSFPPPFYKFVKAARCLSGWKPALLVPARVVAASAAQAALKPNIAAPPAAAALGGTRKTPEPGQAFTKQPGDTAANSKSSPSRSLCHPFLPSGLSGPSNVPLSVDTRNKIGLSWVAVTIPAADKGCLYRACGGWEMLCKLV